MPIRVILLFLTETRLRAPSRIIANLRYEEAVTEADEDGYNFPSATTSELQHALEVLTQHERAEEEQEEEIVEEEEVGDWPELDDE